MYSKSRTELLKLFRALIQYFAETSWYSCSFNSYWISLVFCSPAYGQLHFFMPDSLGSTILYRECLWTVIFRSLHRCSKGFDHLWTITDWKSHSSIFMISGLWFRFSFFRDSPTHPQSLVFIRHAVWSSAQRIQICLIGPSSSSHSLFNAVWQTPNRLLYVWAFYYKGLADEVQQVLLLPNFLYFTCTDGIVSLQTLKALQWFRTLTFFLTTVGEYHHCLTSIC